MLLTRSRRDRHRRKNLLLRMNPRVSRAAVLGQDGVSHLGEAPWAREWSMEVFLLSLAISFIETYLALLTTFLNEIVEVEEI